MRRKAGSAGVLCRLAARFRALNAGLMQDLRMGVLLFTAERRLEIAQALSKRPPDFRQALGPEHEQRDHENEQKMCWLKDVSDHSATSLAAGDRARLR